jgi:hypothetical protein
MLERDVEPAMKINNDLDRIGDCARDIAEDAIYISQGRIIRDNKPDE